jgi:hypothetical protein
MVSAMTYGDLGAGPPRTGSGEGGAEGFGLEHATSSEADARIAMKERDEVFGFMVAVYIRCSQSIRLALGAPERPFGQPVQFHCQEMPAVRRCLRAGRPRGGQPHLRGPAPLQPFRGAVAGARWQKDGAEGVQATGWRGWAAEAVSDAERCRVGAVYKRTAGVGSCFSSIFERLRQN